MKNRVNDVVTHSKTDFCNIYIINSSAHCNWQLPEASAGLRGLTHPVRDGLRVWNCPRPTRGQKRTASGEVMMYHRRVAGYTRLPSTCASAILGNAQEDTWGTTDCIYARKGAPPRSTNSRAARDAPSHKRRKSRPFLQPNQEEIVA